MNPELLAVITAISTEGNTAETVALAQAILAMQPTATPVPTPTVAPTDTATATS